MNLAYDRTTVSVKTSPQEEQGSKKETSWRASLHVSMIWDEKAVAVFEDHVVGSLNLLELSWYFSFLGWKSNPFVQKSFVQV